MLLIQRYILFSFLIKFALAARTDVRYCGFEQRCGRNQTNNVATKYSCCQQCECVDVCKERDTCCADMEKLNDTEEIIKQQCLPAEFVPHSLVDSGNYISYYVRSRCPKTFTDNVEKEHCEKQTNDTLEEITFVSSKDGNIIYRNKFCGLCHGDKTTKPWSLLVSQECLQVLAKADVTLSSVNKVILANCKISLIEPSGLNIKQSICFDDNLIIARCNITGEWDVYNKTLEELCLHPPEAVNYYFHERIFPSVFRSVYCYLCNRKYGISVQEKCQSFERSPGALSALIRQSSLTGSQDEQKTSATCNNDEILDPTFVFWDNRLRLRTYRYEQIYTNYIKPCGTKMPAEYLSTCAKVKLGIHEYKSVLKNHVNANQLLFAPVKGDMNGTMFVCIDTYIVNPHSAGDEAKPNIIVAFATLIIISNRSTF